MSGNRRFLLDTNAIVSLLAGNRELSSQLETAEYVGISVISYLEFLAFNGLSDSDIALYRLPSIKHFRQSSVGKLSGSRRVGWKS